MIDQLKYCEDCIECGITISISGWNDKKCPFCIKGMPWGNKNERYYKVC